MSGRSIKLPGPDHPIAIAHERERFVVAVGGRTIADTTAALTLREADYPPVRYVPRKDVDMDALVRSPTSTYCPFKGDASYFSIPAGGSRSIDARWTYETPHAAVAAIEGYRLLSRSCRPDDLKARRDPPARKIAPMDLNHTIVWSSDQGRSARFLAEMLGRPAPSRLGPFDVVDLDNGLSLLFMGAEGQIQAQHYAFLISETEFDAVFGRVQEAGLPYWADPYHRRPGAINRNDGGRGVYFEDPDGHDLELLTRPYGSGGL